MNTPQRIVVTVLILFTSSINLFAQDRSPIPVTLQNAVIYLDIITPAEIDKDLEPVFEDKYFKLIQFSELPDKNMRTRWSSNGLYLTDYLPRNTYFAVIDRNFNLELLDDRNTITIIDISEQYKIETSLAYEMVSGKSPSELVITYHNHLDHDKVINDLIENGIIVHSHRAYSRQLDISYYDSINTLINLPYIQFIGLMPEEPELEVYFSNSTGRANYLNTGYNGLNYNGEGVTIAIGEGGTLDNHINFKGRMVEMTSGDPGGHKIGCARNAGSGGNEDPTEKNNACGATILSVQGPDYVSLYESHDLRFTNHSYGWGVGGGYSSGARDHDLRSAITPKALVSYSSGNVGGNQGYAPYDALTGWANITGTAKHNKNNFAIRNLDGSDNILTWGSKGPAYDGRILPHLTIEGGGGTSYASPKIVGLMAVIAQVYKDKNGGEEAPANLLRAVLMNTAEDMDDPGPDFKTGYGRPNLRRAYDVVDAAQFLSDSVANNATNSYSLTVPANAIQLRIMLMWPDVAASVNADPAIVNNLNLLVSNPSNTEDYNPWVLDHTPDEVNLDAPAVRAVDTLNTIEQVTVNYPASGTWTINVNGAHVPQGPQTYYIVWEFLMDELYMGFPLKDVKFEPGNLYRIKWDSYGSTSPFDLEYQLDDNPWTTIVNSYDASKRNYDWTAPDPGAGIHRIKFRVSRDALTAESDTCTIGAVPQNLAIDWACSDEVQLSWDSIPGATSYKVYRLMEKYMEAVSADISFSGTSAILSGLSTVEDEHFAVSALTGTDEGLRTRSVAKPVGDINCFNVKATIASNVNQNDIILNGMVNPHNSALDNVHFEYGSTTGYGSVTADVPVSVSGHNEETVNASISSTLNTRQDILNFRLSGTKDGLVVNSDNQEIRLAPGQCLSLDSLDGYLNCGSSAQVTGSAPRSISVWAFTRSFNNGGLFQGGATGISAADFSLRTLTSDDRWRANLWTGGEFDITLPGSKDAWHHYCLTFDGTTVKLYYDGLLMGSGNPNLNTLSNDVLIGRWRNDYFDGLIDEVSIWDKALTESEVRSILHQPLSGDEDNLVSYYQMDGVEGKVFDAVTGKQALIEGNISKVSSPIPFGTGTSYSATEAAGLIDFTGTGFKADYLTQSGAVVLASRMDLDPNTLDGMPVNKTVFDSQYWVVKRYGSEDFSADITFIINEDLTSVDENTPEQIHLYYRSENLTDNWIFLRTASSVDAATNSVTFGNITEFNRQFIVTRNLNPFVSTSTQVLDFQNSNTSCANQIQSYELSGVNITEDLDVLPPADFLVSIDNINYFASLTLVPVNNMLSETVYVKPADIIPGVYSGTIENSSTGAPVSEINITPFELLEPAPGSSHAMAFDGSADYLDIQDLDWNPNSVFTIEWWMNPVNHVSWNQQIGNGWGNFLFHTNGTGVLSAGVTNNSGSRINSAEGVMIPNEWQHIAFTLNGNVARLYHNGELLGEVTESWGINSEWGHFKIGNSGSSTINGQIDEFKMWSVARTQDEIKDGMHMVNSGSEMGLEVYLQFNADTNAVVDFSQNCYTIKKYDNPVRTSSTAPVGVEGILVQDQQQTAIGEAGKNIQVTITSEPGSGNYLGLYRSGSGDVVINTGETFPDSIGQRSDILWGIWEHGEISADLVFDYSQVYGVGNPAEIMILRRTDKNSSWENVSAEFVHDIDLRTFTATGITDFGEYSISLTDYPNSTPVWADLPDISFNEDDSTEIDLDEWVSDLNHHDSLQVYSVSGGSKIMVVIDPVAHTALFTTDPDSSGFSEQLPFTVTDPFGDSATDSLLVTVLPQNDPPYMVQQLPLINIDEDDFAAVAIPRLEEYFNDIDPADMLTFAAGIVDPGLDSVNIINNAVLALVDGWTAYGNQGISSLKRISGTDFTDAYRTLFKNPSLTDTTALLVYPSKDFNGEVRLLLTAIDDSSAAVSDTLQISVLPINDLPVLTAVNDTSIIEDGSLEISLEASDLDNDTLSFAAVSDTSGVITVLNGSILTMTPVSNWNGTTGITITVADNDTAVSDNFVLTVIPENDAPGPFSLITPDDSLTVFLTNENLSNMLEFSWDPAVDVDADTITYEILFTGDLELLPKIVTSDLSSGLVYDSVLTIMNANVLETITGDWTVTAFDATDSTLALNGPFDLIIDASQVSLDNEHLLPVKYALHQNFPNPFNPVTTIRFDIPEQSFVNLTVFDLVGREIVRLVAEDMNPGYHTFKWNATDKYGKLVSAGVYLYQIQTDKFHYTRKMVLLK